jgi:hypothetical protein
MTIKRLSVDTVGNQQHPGINPNTINAGAAYEVSRRFLADLSVLSLGNCIVTVCLMQTPSKSPANARSEPLQNAPEKP